MSTLVQSPIVLAIIMIFCLTMMAIIECAIEEIVLLSLLMCVMVRRSFSYTLKLVEPMTMSWPVRQIHRFIKVFVAPLVTVPCKRARWALRYRQSVIDYPFVHCDHPRIPMSSCDTYPHSTRFKVSCV